MKTFLENSMKTFRLIARYWVAITVAVVLISFIILTYIAITPTEDPTVKAEGTARVESLDIQFNKKLLGELAGTTQTPTVTASGGRDPFTAF